MSPLILKNFLHESEINLLIDVKNSATWKFGNKSLSYNLNDSSYDLHSNFLSKFWINDISESKFNLILDRYISKIIKVDISKILISEIYLNGQAHGQCGFWHRDAEYDKNRKFFTLVYWFDRKWKSEYGGHLMIEIPHLDIISILPEYNCAVLFDSTFLHIGLEPTTHCRVQRVSLAYKFEII